MPPGTPRNPRNPRQVFRPIFAVAAEADAAEGEYCERLAVRAGGRTKSSPAFQPRG